MSNVKANTKKTKRDKYTWLGVMRQIHLKWFGHIERMDNDNWG